MVVSLMVIGLVIFLNADSKSSAVFHPIGICMLMLSLTFDGMFNNWSEVVMEKYNVGQDEFLFQMFSIAFCVMAIFTHMKGELIVGLRFLALEEGTLIEAEAGRPSSCSPLLKITILALFTTTGLLGSSAACGVTKYFGALTMSITSTARKAITLFLSFAIFQNSCTFEHVIGVIIFLSSLTLKSYLASRKLHKETDTTADDESRNKVNGAKYGKNSNCCSSESNQNRPIRRLSCQPITIV